MIGLVPSDDPVGQLPQQQLKFPAFLCKRVLNSGWSLRIDFPMDDPPLFQFRESFGQACSAYAVHALFQLVEP